jgi:hypothetical protein
MRKSDLDNIVSCAGPDRLFVRLHNAVTHLRNTGQWASRLQPSQDDCQDGLGLPLRADADTINI